MEEFARAVAYDRPSLGWSESSPEPLDAVEEAAMLRLAVEELGISGPYVFVGHSMGALMARSFAALYPDEVVGMVLVDPRPVSWGVVYPDGAPEVNELEFRLISLAARFGIIRFIGFTDEFAKGLPLRQFEEGMAKMNTGRHFTESVRDGELGVSAITVIEERERLDDMPVIVLSAGQPDAAFDDDVRTGSTAARADFAELTPNGQHGVVPGTNHFTIVSREDKVQHTADAVRELVEQGGEGNTELEGGRMRARPGTVHVTPVLASGHAALCFCGADSVRGHRRPLL